MPNLPADWKEERLELRKLREDDFDAVVALQLRCFPKMKTWTKEQFESQIRTFPEGQFGIFSNGRLVASSASLIVADADYSDWANWMEMSDHGLIGNHDPEGDTLYGIEIMVDPDMRGMKLARRLYDARKELCRRKDLARIVIGGRIPGYAAHKDAMSAREYVERVMDKALFDPVLTVQVANGFQLRELVKDYMPSDEDSAGWATCLEWPNLDHAALRSHRSRRSVAPVRVSAVQYKMRRVASFEEFAKQAEFFVDVASDQKSDFVLFPELFTLQLLSIVPPSRPGTAARTLAEMTPRYLDLFRGLALRYDVNVIGGSQFVMEGERLYNASYLFRRDGSVDRQLKIHVTPNENRWWGVRGGDALNVFDTDRGRIAILICYDVEFPELARIATHRGAHILFVPFNTNDRIGYLRVLRCAQARCVENQIYVVTAGCVGNLPSVENADTHYSACGIYTPLDVAFARDGIAAEVSPNIETVITQDLDTELLRRARRGGTVRNWSDRRTDLYGVRWAEGDDADKFEDV
jgi:predicted amidohydrolase/ribosomal protein S18 acetylase RimI-like enzyme